MDFDLSEDHKLIRATVRDFAEREIAPRAEAMDRDSAFPYDIVADLADLGLLGVPFPGGVRRSTAATRWHTRLPSRSWPASTHPSP